MRLIDADELMHRIYSYGTGAISLSPREDRVKILNIIDSCLSIINEMPTEGVEDA